MKSVLNQTYPFIELILVDNGSTDNTVKIIRNLMAVHEQIRLVQTVKNIGPSGARNLGIKESKGDYIFLLDGDDLMFPSKIEKQVELMEDHKHIGLSLTSYFIANEKVLNPRLISFKNVKHLLYGWFGMSGFGGLVESTGCIRASLMKDDLFFDETLMGSEGLDFTWKWYTSYVTVLCNEPLTLYRTSEDQLHFSIERIRENVNRISSKYFNGKELREFLKMQNSFFQLNSLRSEPLWVILIGVLKQLDISILKMMLSIVSRNLVALAKGRAYANKIHALFLSVK